VAPSAPGVPAQPGGQAQLGATVARDLVNALIDLLNVQNDFLSVWVDHEVQRLQLDFELGVMELDDNGQRIEHAQSLKSFLAELPHSAPYELPSPCEGVVPDPSMMPAPAESGDSPETLPEPRALEIPSPLGGTNDESPAEVRRLPTLTGDPRPADAQQQEAVPAVLLDHRG
jgi:hypothetical protein